MYKFILCLFFVFAWHKGEDSEDWELRRGAQSFVKLIVRQLATNFSCILWNPTFHYLLFWAIWIQSTPLQPVALHLILLWSVRHIQSLDEGSFARIVGYIEKPSSRNPSPNFLTGEGGGWLLHTSLAKRLRPVVGRRALQWLFRPSVHLSWGFRYTSHCDDDCPSTEWSHFTLSYAAAPHLHTEPLYRVLLLAVDVSVPHPYTRPIGCYSGYVITKLDDIQGFLVSGEAPAPIYRAFLLPRPRNHGLGRFHWPRDQ